MNGRPLAKLPTDTLLIAAAILIALIFAFDSAAFRVDEPNILAIAQQIAQFPLDPYGFEINWLGTSERAYEVLANPPLVPYWLAAWGELFGFSEKATRVAMLPFALLAMWAISSIASRLSPDASLMPPLLLASPGFVLCSLVIMPDMAAAALSAAAVALALRSADEPSKWSAAGAFAAAALGVLAKYNAIVVVVPLVILWWLRKSGRLALIAAAAPVSLLLWSFAGWMKYGAAHVLIHSREQAGSGVLPLHGTVAAFGLAIVPVTLGIALFVRPSWRVALLTAAGGVGAIVSAYALEYPIVPTLLLAVATAVAVRVLLLTFDASLAIDGRVILGAWMYAALLFQMRQLFSSTRYALPMLAPALVLALAFATPKLRRATVIAAIVAGALLSLALAIADTREAELYREVARLAEREQQRFGGPLYFGGHWGAQHYFAAIGAEQYDNQRPARLACGEMFVVAVEAVPEKTKLPVDPPCISLETPVRMNTHWPLKTIDCRSVANFYGNAVGGCDRYPLLLPFGFSNDDDFFMIQRAVRP